MDRDKGYTSPFNDQRPEAADNWARGPVQPPSPPADTSWQDGGYRMEDAPCSHAVPLDESNDTGYVTSIPDGAYSRDPFADDAVDPSLKADRSEDLDSHEGSFWSGAGADAGKGRRKAGRKGGRKNAEKRKLSPNMRVLRGVAVAAAVLIAVGWLTIHFVFSIRTVEVEGNVRISAEQIRDLSGVRPGMNILTLNEKAIGEAIAGNRYLTLVSVQKNMPSGVILHVRERTQAAYINYCGIVYVLDARGMVLEESNDTNAVPALMRLEGLDVKTCVLGRTIAVNKEPQLRIYMEVTTELKAMKLVDEVSELYVTDENNLYLATFDGFSVRLGNADRIHAKLRSMSLTRAELKRRGYSSGTIDVSTPEEPTWIPENE